jgi:glycosyltransferase involved in cell wall biosynthesis
MIPKEPKKKILFLIPSLAGGGAERTLINILNKLSNDVSLEITVGVVVHVGEYVNQIPANVKVVPLFNNNYLVRILAFLQKKIGFSYFFKKIVQKKLNAKYDAAISFLDSNFTDLLFFLPHASKRISWVHSSYKSNMNFYKFYKDISYREQLIKNRYSKLDTIVFVSEDAKSEFVSLFGTYNQMPVIYNLLDEESVHSKSTQLNEESNRSEIFTFIAAGSLFPVKGYDKLIDAAKILKESQLEFKIDIYGQGFLKEVLESQILKSGLDQCVSLRGFVKNPYPLIAAADVFMMTSISEAMPMALCEAILLGKPTLVTNCSGCREVVDYGKYGMMVEQTPKAIAEGMKRFILNADYVKQYKLKARERSLVFLDKTILNKIKEII